MFVCVCVCMCVCECMQFFVTNYINSINRARKVRCASQAFFFAMHELQLDSLCTINVLMSACVLGVYCAALHLLALNALTFRSFRSQHLFRGAFVNNCISQVCFFNSNFQFFQQLSANCYFVYIYVYIFFLLYF